MDLQQRKKWNENHKILTGLFAKPAEYAKAIDLFLNQHALLYSSQMTNRKDVTLEDELLAGMKEKTFRSYPVHSQGTKNSIVWHIWHSTRIEDITMNMLAADNDQILHKDNYEYRLKTGLVLMPATRHNFMHLNKSMRIKHKLQG